MATKTASKPKTAGELARHSFELLQRGDVDEVERLYWDDESVDDFVAIGTFRGAKEIAGFFRETLTAFPDFDIEVERIVEDGDVAVVQWRASGTFTGGPFLGIEPTERPVEIRGIDVMEWGDGKLRHNTIYYDGAEFARQIGMLPQRDSTGERALAAAFNAVSKVRSRIRERR